MKLFAKVFPWCVNLLGLGFVIACFVDFTKSTRFILNWKFNGMESIENSTAGSMCYHFHDASAYIGLWLVVLVGVVLYLMNQINTRLLFWTSCSVLLFSTSIFTLQNLILFNHPDSSYMNKYLNLMSVTSPPTVLIIIFVVLLTSVATIVPRVQNKAATLLASGSIVGSIVLMWVMAGYTSYRHVFLNYTSHVYLMAAESPSNSLPIFFRQLDWPLVLSPAVMYLLVFWIISYYTKASAKNE